MLATLFGSGWELDWYPFIRAKVCLHRMLQGALQMGEIPIHLTTLLPSDRFPLLVGAGFNEKKKQRKDFWHIPPPPTAV